MAPRTASTTEFLADAFDPVSLSLLIAHLDGGEEVLVDFPSADSVSALDFAFSAVKALASRGMLNSDFFAAVAIQRPGRVDDIQRLAARFEPLTNDRPTVLWVDDHPQNNGILPGRLRAAGYRVLLALCTNDALEVARLLDVDVVVTDMGRIEEARFNPDAGFVLLSGIRAMKPDLPVVLVTSDPQLERVEGIARAMNVLVPSDFSLDALLDALEAGIGASAPALSALEEPPLSDAAQVLSAEG